MSRRLELQTFLEQLIGNKNVYFQEPETKKMAYPAIRYALDNKTPIFADNKPYFVNNSYILTVMDLDPDTLIPAKLADVPQCKFLDHYTVNNLNHYIFILSW